MRSPSNEAGQVFVVVPAYNEGKVLATTLQPLLKTGFQVVVVDDGSSDNSWLILSKLPLWRIRHPINLGQGAALQTGTTFALSQGAQYIVHFDADGQHRVRDVFSLLETLKQADVDVVLGSRFLRPEDAASVPVTKRLLLRGAILVNWLLTGIWLTDAHNGLRAFNRIAAKQICLRENGYAHATEILWWIRRLDLRYVECPTHISYPSYANEKGQSIWNAIDIVIDLLLRRFFR